MLYKGQVMYYPNVSYHFMGQEYRSRYTTLVSEYNRLFNAEICWSDLADTTATMSDAKRKFFAARANYYRDLRIKLQKTLVSLE